MNTIKDVCCTAVWVLIAYLSNSFGDQPNLVAYWPFDETKDSSLIDMSDNGNTAYIHSATRVPGIRGNALDFNGTSDYAFCSNARAFLVNDNQFSLECWAYARQINPVSGAGQTFIRNERAYCLGIGAGGKIGFNVCDRGTPAYYGSWTFSNSAIEANVWYYIAAVWNGTTMTVYINGVKDVSGSASLTVSAGTHSIYIGKFVESGYEAFNGIIDEVKIYNSALTSDSIMAHYNVSRPQPPVILIPCLPNPTYNQRPAFLWNKNASIPVYRIQISESDRFSAPVVSVPTADTSYIPFTNLPFGTLYWRVRNETSPFIWSNVSSVTIQDPNIPLLVHYLPSPTRVQKPLLKWHTVAGASAYTIQISDKQDFTSPFITDGTADTAYAPLVNLPQGTIFWRVKSNLSSGYSLPDSFNIVSDSVPILISFSPDTQTTSRPNFVWHPATGAASYRIQVSTSKDFSNLFISLPVPDTTYRPMTGLPSGRMFWRVGAMAGLTRYSLIDSVWIKAPSQAFGPYAQNSLFGRPLFHQSGHLIFITVAAEKTGPVSLDIYATNGRHIASMQETGATKGQYTLVWNGVGEKGTFAPNGRYLSRTRVNGAAFVQPFVVMR